MASLSRFGLPNRRRIESDEMSGRARTGRSRCRLAVEGLEVRDLLSTVGGLDSSFGSGGQFLRDVVPGNATGLLSFYSLAVRPDGKVVAGGMVGLGSRHSYGVLQLNANGTPDTAFGQFKNGEADLVLPDGYSADAKLAALKILPDGHLLVAGSVVAPSGQVESIVGRLNLDGSQDPSFGNGGIVFVGGSGVALHYMAVEPDGKIVLAGSASIPSSPTSTEVAAARILPDGRTDPSFGYHGLVLFSTVSPGSGSSMTPVKERAAGVAIAPDGRIVLLGDLTTPRPSTYPLVTGEVFRLNPDGSRDLTLGQSGVQAARFSTADANGVLVQPDGKILVLGFEQGLPDAELSLLARLNVDGTLDGMARLPHRESYVLNYIALEPDGSIMTTGDSFYTNFFAFHFKPDLSPDLAFGFNSESFFPINNEVLPRTAAAEVVALTPDNKVVLAGTSNWSTTLVVARIGGPTLTSTVHPAPTPTPVVTVTPRREVPGDYTGAGVASPAVYLPSVGAFAIRNPVGGPDQIIPFGIAGAGQSIPAPGDYDGSGHTELAVYLPSQGDFAIRPAGGGPDRIIPFGIAGAGQSIPVPGDYFGTGQTDLAVYLPALGAFAIRNPADGTDHVIPFGLAGAGQSIPAPGDYYGTGQTDLALYLPALGSFAIRNPVDGTDHIIPFGLAGAGQSIPAPGDYYGTGQTDLALYLPALGSFAIRNPVDGTDHIIPFGLAGAGQSIPAPGDYDASGHAELAVYLPSQGAFAIRPRGGNTDLIVPFGLAGPAQTIPAVDASSATKVVAPPVVVPPVVAQGTIPVVVSTPRKKVKGRTRTH